MRRFLRWLPVVAWMGLIFSASADTQSVARTSRFLEPFCRWIYPSVTPEQLEAVRWIVRKGAHLGEFAIFGALLFYALGRRRMWLAWGIAVVYAAADEFHQTFIPGRNGCVQDVLIDAVGAAIGVAVCWGYLKWRERDIRDERD